MRNLLLSAILVAVCTGAISFYNASQATKLTDSLSDLDRASLRHRATVKTMEIAADRLQSYLVASKSSANPSATYDAWSESKWEARAAVKILRQRPTLLIPEDRPVAPAPELIETLEQLRPLTATLVKNWLDYEKQGSGITPASELLATNELLPLVTEKIAPALLHLDTALQIDTARKADALPVLITAAQKRRFVWNLFCLAALGVLVSGSFISWLERPPVSPTVPATPSSRSPSPAVMPTNFMADAVATPADRPSILIAEHSSTDCEVMSLMVTDAGYAVIGCDHGADARDAIQTIRFDLLLLDAQLPGANPLELLYLARANNPKASVIFLVDPADDAQDLLEAGHAESDLLRKPADPRALLAKIDGILRPQTMIGALAVPPPPAAASVQTTNKFSLPPKRGEAALSIQSRAGRVGILSSEVISEPSPQKLRSPAANRENPVGRPAAGGSPPLKFLLVDDDTEKRFLLARQLTVDFSGASVLETSSAVDAITLLKGNAIDALITDHSMVPINGIELIKWTRTHYAPLPIVMVTGHPSIEQEALAAGASLVMGSFHLNQIGATLKPLLASQKSRPVPEASLPATNAVCAVGSSHTVG